jgi:prevent-host-death family protein
MTTVSISEIKRDVSAIINRVAFGGERIVLTSRGRPKAALVSIDDLERLRELDKDVVAHRARRKAALDQARAVREKVAARVGGILPDSADELRELREERTDELAGLR